MWGVGGCTGARRGPWRQRSNSSIPDIISRRRTCGKPCQARCRLKYEPGLCSTATPGVAAENLLAALPTDLRWRWLAGAAWHPRRGAPTKHVCQSTLSISDWVNLRTLCEARSVIHPNTLGRLFLLSGWRQAAVQASQKAAAPSVLGPDRLFD